MTFGIRKNFYHTATSLIESIGSGINPLLLKLKNEDGRVIAFGLHGIFTNEIDRTLEHVTPQNNLTCQQLEDLIYYFLENNYRFLSTSHLHDELDIGQRYAMLTFDDGYYNNSLAEPILAKYQVPATFFITTNNVINNKAYWWDVIYRYRRKEGISEISIQKEQEYLKQFRFADIQDYIWTQFGKYADHPVSDVDRPFSKEELKRFSASPWVTIGNHASKHALLTLYEEHEVRELLKQANEDLSDMVGYTPTVYAPPNGSFNEETQQVASELFSHVFTTRPRQNYLPLSNNQHGLVNIDRYVIDVSNIRRAGPFCRVGYHPHSLYSGVKHKARSLRKLAGIGK